jgi:predicted GNAT superfamily acetyltransferase
MRKQPDRGRGLEETTVPAARPLIADELDPAATIDVRQLVEHADLSEGVTLQRRVWGEGYRDSVPASMLKISQKVGGLAAGAFLASGEMVGFVYGLTGVDASRRIIHWSHMLAVLPEHRNHGIGRRLKTFQREFLSKLGVEASYWTFDPLVARNAHLNLNLLGVRLIEYVPDMYADTGSDLHAFGTDRFIAEWPLRAERTPSLNGDHSPASPSPVHDAKRNGDGPPADAVVRIEIPEDAEAMRTHALPALREWRATTRAAFLERMAAGYGVTGFVREQGRSFYVLQRGA